MLTVSGVVDLVKRSRTPEPHLHPLVVSRLATVASDPRSWVATCVVVFVGAVLRLAGLRHPNAKIFDEVYYATEADELIRHGVEWQPDNNTGDFVAHPPLGKWCIALGELVFGYNSFGWRIPAALAGIVSIVLVVRIGRRLFRSTVLGCAAGLLVSLDGLHLVLSRTAMLDVFLMLFVLAAFGCVVLERDQRRTRALAFPVPVRAGFPAWRLLAAVFLGCAVAVKLSALAFLPVVLLIALMWDVGLRRTLGERRPWWQGVRRAAGWGAAVFAVAGGVYLASWAGWFLTDTGWNRHGLLNSARAEAPVVGALQNLWEYHKAVYTFHRGLVVPHDFQSWPWQWLLMARPVRFFTDVTQSCGAERCVAQVMLLGTPLLWWSFIPALAGLAWFGVAARDRRAAAIGLMVAAGLLPWFWYHYDGGRTMFVFYALPAEPFLVLAVVYVLGALMGPPGTSRRRMTGAFVAGVYLLLIAACFAYFHPLYVGESIPQDAWWDRMWLGRLWN